MENNWRDVQSRLRWTRRWWAWRPADIDGCCLTSWARLDIAVRRVLSLVVELAWTADLRTEFITCVLSNSTSVHGYL